MPFRIPCADCGLTLVLTDELFERKVKNHSVTIKCSGCGAGTHVDGKRLAAGSDRQDDDDPEFYDRPTVEIAHDEVSQREPIDDFGERKTLELKPDQPESAPARPKKRKKRARPEPRAAPKIEDPARSGSSGSSGSGGSSGRSAVWWVVALGALGLGGWYFTRARDEPQPQPTLTRALDLVARSALPPPLASAPPPLPTESTASAPESGDAAPSQDSDERAIRAELARIADAAAQCRMRGDPAGTAYVTVRVESSGRVKYAKVGAAPFVDTPTARCIEGKMLAGSLPAFRGDELTVTQAVRIY